MIDIKEFLAQDEIFKSLENLSKKYSEEGLNDCKTPTKQELKFYHQANVSFNSAIYMPHSYYQYQDVLNNVNKNDVIIDMGCGDLRLAYLLSKCVKKVYAVELNPEILYKAIKVLGYNKPMNLIIVLSDWVYFPIPCDVSKIVCLCANPIIPKEWFDYDLLFGQNVDGKLKIINAKIE